MALELDRGSNWKGLEVRLGKGHNDKNRHGGEGS
jgi:hypothetical protein